MIKHITNDYINENLDSYVEITSKLISTSNNNYNYIEPFQLQNHPDDLYIFNSNYILVLKLEFKNLDSSDSILKLLIKLRMHALNLHSHLKVYKINTNLVDFPLSASTLYNSISFSTSSLIDQLILYPMLNYGDGYSTQSVDIDLTRIAQSITPSNNKIFLAIKGGYTAPNFIYLFTPEYLSDNENIVDAEVLKNDGLNNINKFDEVSCSLYDKGYINLSNGSVIHNFNLITSLGKRMPIPLKMSHNCFRTNNSPYFNFNLKLNYEFVINYETIESETTISIYKFLIEDYSGVTKTYDSYENTEKNRELLGIDRYIEDLALFYSADDGSYLFSEIINDTIHLYLYDINENFYHLKSESNRFVLVQIKNSYNDEINFSYNEGLNNELITITNTSNDLIKVYYTLIDNKKIISRIEDVNTSRMITIDTYENYILIKYNKGNDEYSCYKKLKINFYINNTIESIQEFDENNNQMNKLEYIISNNKISTVNRYDSLNNKISYKNYTYLSKYTKISDNYNNTTYHYFDLYNRPILEINDNYRCLSYSYNSIDEPLKGVSSITDFIVKKRCLIENHSFEYLDNNQDLIGWDLTGNKKYSLSDDCLYGGKSLFINTLPSDSLKLTQNIYSLSNGTYSLKINARALSSLNNLSIKVKLTYMKKDIIVNGGAIEINAINPGLTLYNEEYPVNLTNLDGNWKSFSTNNFTISALMINLVVSIEINASGLNQVYLDDFNFSDGDKVVRYNLINNGSFENVSGNRPSCYQFENLSNDDTITSSLNDETTHALIFSKKVMHLDLKDVTFDGTEFVARKLYQLVNVKGYKGDCFTYSIFARCFLTINTKLRAYITFNYLNTEPETIYFNFLENINTYQLLSKGIRALYDYESIIIGVEYDGFDHLYIDSFELNKDTFTTYYNYTPKGKIIDISKDNGKSINIKYDKNKPTYISYKNNAYFKYEYDSIGRLSKIIDSFGTTIDYTYGTNESKYDVTSTSISYYNGTNLSSIVFEYSYDNLGNITTEIDEHDNSFNYMYDTLRRVVKVTNPNNLEINKEYDYLSNVERVYCSLNPNSNYIHSNDITYNKTLNLVSNVWTGPSNNRIHYDYIYDSTGRLLEVKQSNLSLEKYEYNSVLNSINKNLITSKRYGSSGDLFTFDYDNKNRLTQVYLNSSLAYQYSYNEESLVSETIDHINNKKTFYSYDSKDRLERITNDDYVIKKGFDNNDNPQKVIYSNDYVDRINLFEYDYEHTQDTKDGFIKRLSKYNDEIILPSFKGESLGGLKPTFYNAEVIMDSTINSQVFECAYRNNYLLYDLNKVNENYQNEVVDGKKFNLYEWKRVFRYIKTFYLWFKPEQEITNRPPKIINILRLMNLDSENKYLASIDINTSFKIIYRDRNQSVKLTTSNSINFNEYNFLSFTILRNSNNDNVIKITLNNTETQNVIVNESVFSVNGFSLSKQYIESLEEGLSSSELSHSNYLLQNISYCVPFVGVSNKNYSLNEYKNMNSAFNKYFISSNTRLSRSSLLYYSFDKEDDYDLITLDNEVNSLKGLRPINYIKPDEEYDITKNTLFRYDNLLNRYLYCVIKDEVDQILKYDFNISTNFTMSLLYKTIPNPPSYGARTIVNFKDKDTNNDILKIFLTPYGLMNSLVIQRNSDVKMMSSISENTWQNLFIKLDNGSLYVYLDNIVLSPPLSNIDLSNSICYIGALNDDIGNPFNGYIMDIKYSLKAISYDYQKEKKSRPKIYADITDNLGRLVNKNIVIGDECYEYVYNYDKLRISSEMLVTDEGISYEYDSMNNVSVTNFDSNITRYEYDKLNELTNVYQNNTLKYHYEYDAYGNITRLTKPGTINELSFAYGVGGRLITVYKKVNNNDVVYRTITYNSDNPFYPSSLTINSINKSLSFSGKRLMSIGSDISFTYNDKGIRTSKTTSDALYEYELDESRIISLRKTSNQVVNKIYFNYDLNGSLSSLTYNNKEYIYVRDTLQNILGIIDTDRNYIVKYSYSPFGEVTRTILSNDVDDVFIANNNPFIFKGYYYDFETNLYYLNSRYYDPELCRFITPDNYSYLDNNNPIGLNLYMYCGNNPVMNIDPSGYSWFRKCLDWVETIIGTFNPISLLISVTAVAVAAITGRTDELKEDFENGCFNIFNQSEETAINAKVFSFYKGSKVVRLNGNRGFTIFGTIWAGKENFSTKDLKHEHGHHVQEMILGPLYLINIAAPSIIYYYIDDKYLSKMPGDKSSDYIYYSTPWEVTADWLGGVEGREYKKGSLAWGIIENLLGPSIILLYLLFGY